LKERALGVEVFGREPSYDTSLDPVVRTSACEVRKRIAQYYHEPGRENELRIDLPSGSYVPEFHFPEPPAAPPPPIVSSVPGAAATVVPDQATHFSLAVSAIRAHPFFAAGALAILALGVAGASLRGAHSSLEQFWGPVLGKQEPVLICMGGRTGLERAQEELSQGPAIAPVAREVAKWDRLAFSDAITMGRVFSLIHGHSGSFDVRRASALTLTDLRKGPVVLIGGFNNEWTMRLEKDLRYRFEREPDRQDGSLVIRDRQDPTHVRWRVNEKLPYNQVPEDYAIVSRVMDPLTERVVVTVAGMMKDGTVAAGEFVTEERYMSALAARAPSGWERKNVEVVLGTELVRGVPGPPRVLAASFW
jgi:hypothetical protein